MRLVYIFLAAVLVFSSCMHESCPTYSGSKRPNGFTASAKKPKGLVNKSPYYKTLKRAEQD